MADWKIFTPPREPRTEELDNNMVFVVYKEGGSTVSARIMYLNGSIVVQFLFVEPNIIVRYEFSSKKWLTNSGDPIDITTVDLTIPEKLVSSATTKAPFFNLMAFEEGTTASKLAAVEDAKLLIKNSIINKGVDVPDGTKFREYAWKIGDITSGVSLSGKIFKTYSASGSANATIQLEDGKKYVIFLNMVEIQRPERYSAKFYEILDDRSLKLANGYISPDFDGYFLFTLNGNELKYNHSGSDYIYSFFIIEQ